MVRLERQDPFPDWESARLMEGQSEKKIQRRAKIYVKFWFGLSIQRGFHGYIVYITGNAAMVIVKAL